jgi:hypothetical protein
MSSESSARETRAATNQALFRQANEQVEPLNEAFSVVLPLSAFVCECADETCTQQISLTLDEYEAVRSDPHRFAVAPGGEHVLPEIERVVGSYERYVVVEKVVARELTERLDERSHTGPRTANGGNGTREPEPQVADARDRAQRALHRAARAHDKSAELHEQAAALQDARVTEDGPDGADDVSRAARQRAAEHRAAARRDRDGARRDRERGT